MEKFTVKLGHARMELYINESSNGMNGIHINLIKEVEALYCVTVFRTGILEQQLAELYLKALVNYFTSIYGESHSIEDVEEKMESLMISHRRAMTDIQLIFPFIHRYNFTFGEEESNLMTMKLSSNDLMDVFKRRGLACDLQNLAVFERSGVLEVLTEKIREESLKSLDEMVHYLDCNNKLRD